LSTNYIILRNAENFKNYFFFFFTRTNFGEGKRKKKIILIFEMDSAKSINYSTDM